MLFIHSPGINVPRRRFLPVKKTSDLLVVMSNLFTLKNGTLIMNPDRTFPSMPLVKLGDPDFTKVSSRCSLPETMRREEGKEGEEGGGVSNRCHAHISLGMNKHIFIHKCSFASHIIIYYSLFKFYSYAMEVELHVVLVFFLADVDA